MNIIHTKSRIKKAYKQTSPNWLLFKNTDKRKAYFLDILYLGGMLLLFPGVFAILYLLWGIYLEWWVIAGCVIWVSFGIMGFYAIINPYYKKLLRSRGIIAPKEFFSHWSDTPYQEFRLSEFHKLLIKERLLTNSVTDIDVINKYRDIFFRESERLFKRPPIILGSLLLAFAIAIANQSLAIIFKQNDLFEAISFSLLIFSILLAIAMGLSPILPLWNDGTKYKSKQYKEIAECLEEIQANILLSHEKLDE